MTKGSFYAFLLGSVLMAAPGAVSAQTVAELRPTGQWLVNNTGIDGLAQAGGDMRTPCIMANQFNNGFILRLSGGGGQLLSLSLDFRQNAFTQGDTYPLMLSVDGGNSYSLTATAFSPGILLVGLREAQGLYQAVQAGRSLALNVVGNTMIFSLANVRDGMNRLESCFSPPSMQSQPARPIATAEPVPTVPDTQVYVKREAYPEFRQPTAQDILKADAMPSAEQSSAQASSAQTAAPAQTAAAGVPELAVPAMPPLSASELAELDLTAEDLKPYNPPPIAPQAQGMSIAKVEPLKLPEAQSVPVVEAQPVAMPQVQPVAKVEPRQIAAPEPRAITPPPVQEVAAVTPRPFAVIDAPRISPASAAPTSLTPPPAAEPAQWSAKAGEDIRVVLARWATLAGTDLVWEADGGGRVARDMNVQGSFEDAVAQIMADNAAAMGIRGQFADGDALTPVLAEQGQRASNQTASAGASAAPRTADALRADKGDDLQAVLQKWAAQSDVALDWQADERFALIEPVQTHGDVTKAIEAALTQFDNETVRPVGRLNRDPATGQLSLTIQTDRAS